jgi:hypothetical protein
MASGPALPFKADLTSPRLDIDIVLGAEVAGPLNTLRGILGWGTIRGVYMLSGGRLFVDSGY